MPHSKEFPLTMNESEGTVATASGRQLAAFMPGDMRHLGATIIARANLHQDAFELLVDSIEILPVALEAREQATGEKDDVLRDLIRRIKKATKLMGAA